MADLSITGTMTGTGSGSGFGICACCCPSRVQCDTDDDCDPGGGTFCVNGCCSDAGPCGGCPECSICVGSGEDVECAFCPTLADFSDCFGADTATRPECSGYDYDGSGTVDFLDFAYYRNYCNGCG